MCWKCGKDIKTDHVSREDSCPECGRDLRCCRNCEFFESGAHYDCHETISDPVPDKERSNFCDYFKLKKNFGTNVSGKSLKSQQAIDAFNALFSD